MEATEDSSADRGGASTGDLERRVAELERLSKELSRVPDGELPALLERAVELVDEVNAGIENHISAMSAESGKVEGLLDQVDFGHFDAALRSLEHESPGEPDGESPT